MATAAVSIASFLLGHGRIAFCLVLLNWVFYVALWLLTCVRAICFPRRMVADLFDHQRAPGFFTLVAGTCMLATQTILVTHDHTVGRALWWLGLGLWLWQGYGFSGGWL